ncbi:MAG: hypothetical protein ACJAXE_002034, partial [Neolewinella sp.]
DLSALSRNSFGVYHHSGVWYAGEKKDDRQEEREAFHG